MKLKEALGIKYGEVISLVGGGGKTTLMFALARELATGKGCIITTTTTKIFEPSLSQTQYLLLEKEEDRIVDILKQSMEHYNHITLAKSKLSSGKLEGVSPDLVFRLTDINGVSCIIVEADGANHLPLKAPNATEPVIPLNTSLLVPVVGIDAVGCNLDEENVFRPQIVSELTGIPLGGVITIESIAFLITDNRGIIKGSPDHTRIIPFINKVDLDTGLVKSIELANKILEVRHPQIKQVVLGQVQSEEPVIKVVTSGAR
jgi:probable selenium-dependent hydroxylase accessory protein YqeC